MSFTTRELRQVLPEDDIMAERNPDVSEPVVGLVVPEEEIDGRNVLHSPLPLLEVSFDMLLGIK